MPTTNVYWVTACAVLAVCGAFSASLRAETKLESLDVYGTEVLDPNAIRAEMSLEISAIEAAIGTGDIAKVGALKAKIVRTLQSGRDFAYIDMSLIFSFPPTPGLYATIDVVEAADAARRMPFHSAPTGSFPDPDGLAAAWHRFEQDVVTVGTKGEFKGNSQTDCPVLHCIALFDHELLRPYLPLFNGGAKRHKSMLLDMAQHDGNSQQRAAAIFLLAHVADVDALMPILSNAIYDPDQSVRNNAMRVMMAMAARGMDAKYPIDDILVALDFPATTDRNKAAYLTLHLVEQFPRYREIVKRNCVPTLLRLMSLKQPNNRDPAHATLKVLSGRDFEADAKDWMQWASDQSAIAR